MSDTLVEERVRELYPEAASIDCIAERVSKGVRVQRLTIATEMGDELLVVKHYFGSIEPSQVDRPRLGLLDDRSVKPTFEYQGLVGLHDMEYGDAWDVRPVRPVSYDESSRLLIMEEFPGTSLRTRLEGHSKGLLPVFRTGGAALAYAHRLPCEEPAIRSTMTPIDEAFDELLGFVLSKRGVRVHRRLDAWWGRQPEAELELGAAHGDCSARNLLVSDAGAVAWIDGLFRYRSPVYEDVATFTTTTRTTLRLPRKGHLDARARGHAADAFVDGYCDVRPEFDRSLLARFEVLVLLDRQASLLSSQRSLRNRLLLSLTDRELAVAMGHST